MLKRCQGIGSIEVSPLLQKTALYREFAAERAEILKHKWLESEKAGRDLGFDWALIDWILKHRGPWMRSRRQQWPPRPERNASSVTLVV
jgi:hypothetical protein